MPTWGADLPVAAKMRKFLAALLGALISAVTTRRGLAVAAVIVVLVVSYTVVAAVQGIAMGEGQQRLAEVAGLFSPYTLVDGILVWLFDVPPATPAPPSNRLGVLYLLSAVVVVGAVAGMLARYRKATAI